MVLKLGHLPRPVESKCFLAACRGHWSWREGAGCSPPPGALLRSRRLVVCLQPSFVLEDPSGCRPGDLPLAALCLHPRCPVCVCVGEGCRVGPSWARWNSLDSWKQSGGVQRRGPEGTLLSLGHIPGQLELDRCPPARARPEPALRWQGASPWSTLLCPRVCVGKTLGSAARSGVGPGDHCGMCVPAMRPNACPTVTQKTKA